MMEALGVIRQPELASLFGAEWFKGGRTKKAALSRPVHLENITPKAPPWRRVSMTDVPPHNDIYYQLGLWNGLDRPASCSFSITLYEPALDPRRLQIPGLETDTIIIPGPELALLESTSTAWHRLLDICHLIANLLGGRAEITSDELWDLARGQTQLSQASDAAYAAFWGIDRSTHNPLYRPLGESNATGPSSMVASDSWEQVTHPDVERLQRLIDCLARPSAR
jgi:hypothetical protein